MMQVSFYDPATGLFIGRTVSSTMHSEPPPSMVPPGMKWVAGKHDHLSKKVDLKTGEVVDYQPPSPGAEYSWDIATKRWKLTSAAEERRRRGRAALHRVNELEARSHRAVREFLLGDATALERLRVINDEITALRPTAFGQTSA